MANWLGPYWLCLLEPNHVQDSFPGFAHIRKIGTGLERDDECQSEENGFVINGEAADARINGI